VIQLRKEGYSLGEISNKIAHSAIEAGCTDNVTLLIVDLHDYYLKYSRQTMVDTSSIYINLEQEQQPKKKTKIVTNDHPEQVFTCNNESRDF